MDRVVAPEDLDRAVDEELDLVLSLPASSIAATKQLFNDVHGRPPRECRDYTANALADAQAASAAVKTQLNWTSIRTFGKLPTDLTALYESLSRNTAGGDDVNPLLQFGGGESKFWDITNGCFKYLGEFPFAIPDGDYFGYAMRSYSFSSHWKLWLTINRS